MFPPFFCPLIIDPAGRAVPAGTECDSDWKLVLNSAWVLVRAWIRFAMSSSTLLPLTGHNTSAMGESLRLPRKRLDIESVVSWTMIDERRSLCVRIRFLWTRTALFAQRGVVLVYIAVPPVIVRTLAQTCRNLWWFHRCSPWTSCGYASYCADSGSDVQKTVETFHSCSSWSMLLVNFGAAQWSRQVLPCSKEAFVTHSGACRCVRAPGTHSQRTEKQLVVSDVVWFTFAPSSGIPK